MRAVERDSLRLCGGGGGGQIHEAGTGPGVGVGGGSSSSATTATTQVRELFHGFLRLRLKAYVKRCGNFEPEEMGGEREREKIG